MTSRARAERFDPGQVLRVPARVMTRELGGEMVLLDAAMENYYGLNEVGARLVRLAAGGATFGALVEALASEYDVEHGQLESDLGRLVAELLDSGLLERG